MKKSNSNQSGKGGSNKKAGHSRVRPHNPSHPRKKGNFSRVDESGKIVRKSGPIISEEGSEKRDDSGDS